jgi:hypothetical protein
MKQNNNYRLVGRPESGYSLKIQSALRFKRVRFEWMDRFKNEAIYQQHAKVQLIPLLLLADGSAMQDSTPILEMLEAEYPESSMHPLNPALRFLSEVLEEYGDEWVNKVMFQYRWGYPADQQRRGTSLSNGVIEGKGLGWAVPLILPFVKRTLIKIMLPRMAFAGANKQTELKMSKCRYYQKTFKYPAGSLAILRSKFKAVNNDTALTSFLEATHCLTYLEPQ